MPLLLKRMSGSKSQARLCLIKPQGESLGRELSSRASPATTGVFIA
jgi:hypothetical protein